MGKISGVEALRVTGDGFFQQAARVRYLVSALTPRRRFTMKQPIKPPFRAGLRPDLQALSRDLSLLFLAKSLAHSCWSLADLHEFLPCRLSKRSWSTSRDTFYTFFYLSSDFWLVLKNGSRFRFSKRSQLRLHAKGRGCG